MFELQIKILIHSTNQYALYMHSTITSDLILTLITRLKFIPISEVHDFDKVLMRSVMLLFSINGNWRKVDVDNVQVNSGGFL